MSRLVTFRDQLVFGSGAMNERTKAKWKAVLRRAGYTISGLYSWETGFTYLNEAELVYVV